MALWAVALTQWATDLFPWAEKVFAVACGLFHPQHVAFEAGHGRGYLVAALQLMGGKGVMGARIERVAGSERGSDVGT